jgi:anti-sigma regulatory factor (Ser/Thr protein kinase)
MSHPLHPYSTLRRPDSSPLTARTYAWVLPYNRSWYGSAPSTDHGRATTLCNVKSQISRAEIGAPVHEFVQLFSSTPRGARLARHTGVRQLAAWGWPYDDEVSQTGSLLIAELAANAALHGRVVGRRFRLRMATGPGLLLPAMLRIEVADARGESVPPPAPPQLPPADAESGRGLPLVQALATRWGTVPRSPSGKTVWADLDLEHGQVGHEGLVSGMATSARAAARAVAG